MELDVASAAEGRNRIQQELSDLQKRREPLAPLVPLSLSLDDYRGYESLAVIVGSCEADPRKIEGDLSLATSGEHEMFEAPPVYAIFVPRRLLAPTQEALRALGFKEQELPEGQGSPADELARVERFEAELKAKLERAEGELARLREQHRQFLVAAEEDLTIEVEKSEAPISFATSEHAFVAEAWVPASDVAKVRLALERASGGDVHVDVLAHAVAHADAHHGGAHAAPQAEPPTKYENARAFRPFQFFTDLVSTPKYDEIDPTPVLALILPLFLGFMIGDFGYGILMVLIGVLLVRRLGHLQGVRELGIAVALAGIVAGVLGAVVFAEAFGIHFFIPNYEYEHIKHVLEDKHAAITAASVCSTLYHEGAVSWGCLLGMDLHADPMLSKLTQVTDLLVLSVLAAFVHMGLGLVFGMVNAWGHSKRHVLAKFGWLALMIGFFVQILYMAGYEGGNRVALGAWNVLGVPEATIAVAGVGFHVALLAALVLGAILLAVGEGPITVLELPAMLSNLLSYTRLAGLAVAKAAMAAAFTSLTLVAMVLDGTDLLFLVIGLVLFVITQLFVFVLGVFSSGIQAIRLNYVEFFNKFYTGGGKPFAPFGKRRIHTIET